LYIYCILLKNNEKNNEKLKNNEKIIEEKIIKK